jgi:hypothetical protein
MPQIQRELLYEEIARAMGRRTTVGEAEDRHRFAEVFQRMRVKYPLVQPRDIFWLWERWKLDSRHFGPWRKSN